MVAIFIKYSRFENFNILFDSLPSFEDNVIEKKAPLVARGYEDDTTNVATDSPTVNKESLRLTFMIVASKQWNINSLDIRAAFLQGQKLTRVVYIKPPREANMKGKLWKLIRCVYGLNDASRNFYLTVKGQLIKLGCKCSHLDQAVFTYYNDGLEGILLSHVDDFLWAGSTDFERRIIQKIKTNFKISSENSLIFRYLGVDIQQCSHGIYISQNKDTQKIEQISIAPNKDDEPLNEEEKSDLRSAVGSLNWLVLQSRPDLAYDVCDISSNLHSGTTSLLRRTNRVIKNAQFQPVCLYFPKMDLDNLSISVYGDASHGNLNNGGSQCGIFTEINSGSQSCPIEWHSKRIRRVATSTLAAETMALGDAISSACYIKALAEEMLYGNMNSNKIKITCYTDNYSLFETAHATTTVKDRRTRIEIAAIREAVKEG